VRVEIFCPLCGEETDWTISEGPNYTVSRIGPLCDKCWGENDAIDQVSVPGQRRGANRGLPCDVPDRAAVYEPPNSEECGE